MPFPFGKSQKSPADIVRSLKENVAYMEKMDAGDSKKCEKVGYGLILDDFFYSYLHPHLTVAVTLFHNSGRRGGVQKPGLPEGGT